MQIKQNANEKKYLELYKIYRPLSLFQYRNNLKKQLKFRKIVGKFLNKYKVISANEYGFREGKSTDDAIFTLTYFIYNVSDKEKATLCISIVLSQAFDTGCQKKSK